MVAIKEVPGEIINIGSGVPISLTDLANLMLKIAKRETLKIIYRDPHAGDVINSYTDISKAKNLLKFEPKFNQEDGLKDYFNWQNKIYGTNLGE
jgi:nucleoside-diphosphate-sugar epimerase